MSLHKIAIDEHADFQTHSAVVKVWDWVRSQMDFPKFRRRANYARGNPRVPVKVVLMEYAASYRDGDSMTHHYVPNGGPNTSSLQYDRDVKHYLHYQISDNDPNVIVYSRRKIVDGTPHMYLRQLVVKFNAYDPPSPVEELDEDIAPTQG